MLWAGVLLLVGVAQLRFLQLGVALCAPLCAAGLAELARRLAARLGQRRERRWVVPALVVVTIYLVSPAIDYLAAMRFVPGPPNYAQEALVRWLGRHARPTEAVLAPLGLAQPVVHLARRPVVGSMLIEPSTEQASRDTLAFFTGFDLEGVQRIAQQRRVRWVLARRMPFERFARLRQLLDPLTDDDEARTLFRRSLASRLQLDSGAAAVQGSLVLEPVRWLRHCHETRAFGRWRAAEVYRVVAGARLQGRGVEEGELVSLRLIVETNRGRRFVYRDWQRGDVAGAFTFVVPYSTTGGISIPCASQGLAADSEELTRVVGRVQIHARSGRIAVDVPAAAVEHGLSVELPPLDPGPPRRGQR